MGSAVATTCITSPRPHLPLNSNLTSFDFILLNIFSKCVNVSQYMSGKPVAKSETPVGSSIALSMGSSLMVRCQVTKQSEEEMTHSTHSSQKLELENTFLEQFLSTLNQQ